MEILDASDAPDSDLARDVYAYFGLCMYFAQVFETGLIGILTSLQFLSEGVPGRRERFEEIYALNERLTFGNLIKGLKKFSFLESELLARVISLKALRDELAHRFFRDHELDHATVAGCWVMIDRLEEMRAQFQEVDQLLEKHQIDLMEKIGFPPEVWGKIRDADLERMRAESKNRYRSIVPKQ